MNYMPGTASLIEDIDKKHLVLLRDGRTLIGFLRSIDQFEKFPGTVAHTCNPSSWEAEAGGLQVRNQPGHLSKTLSQKGTGYSGVHLQSKQLGNLRTWKRRVIHPSSKCLLKKS
ncbi:U6 snRNA-associated Sm-like protein LSm1 isoform X3 [Marmota flaviventris]|uniref:U6 snRNA-associated Sm-like protein LSm1 isoform X3 n=1 Tax=Marmota flaviventris TaxID=93162 RepID=UPI003A865C76